MQGEYFVADVKGTNGKVEEFAIVKFDSMVDVNSYINRAGGSIKDYFHHRFLIKGDERVIAFGRLVNWVV
jgi:lipopolysaccharide/colanic/teichoic acid biosynthesis glycosyltransferase